MTVIFAAPRTTELKNRPPDQGKDRVWAYELQTAINRAEPGDTVKLIPGSYHRSVTVNGSGKRGKPITIEGPDEGKAILDGLQTPENGQNTGIKPEDGDFAFIKLVHTQKIVLRGLTFVNNWPSCIYLRATRDIQIDNCDFVGGRFAIYARQGLVRKTKRILIENCSWIQDPLHRMWRGDVSWESVKKQDPAFDASYFNGAFFGSFDISGHITIRHCIITHAFNAIRMDIRKEHVKKSKTKGPKLSRNKHVYIYGNTFSFIRDNAIEPEAGAEDWRIFENHFLNIHGIFSLDLVDCRDMFYLCNTILNNRKPEQGNTPRSGGKVFKYLGLPDEEGVPLENRKYLWSAFNSVQTRTSYAKKSRTAYWRDAYNAVGFYDANFPEETDDIRSGFDQFMWQAGDISIIGMVTNEPLYPDQYPQDNIDDMGFGRVEDVFQPLAFAFDPSDPLGGWDGRLEKSPALSALKSCHLKMDRANGPAFKVRGGLTPGLQTIADLALDWDTDAILPRL